MMDEEHQLLAASPEFWRMIAARRRETETISLEEFIAELEAEEKLGARTDSEAQPNHDPADDQ